jgi:hypothetical protein
MKKPELGKQQLLPLLVAIPAAAFAFWWYSKPLPWLGGVMALLAGVFSYSILSARRTGFLRRVLYITLFFVVTGTLVVVISNMGTGTFMAWVTGHDLEYYLPNQSIGTISYSCPLVVPQIFRGRAAFLPVFGVWQTKFPSSPGEFLALMLPFIGTFLLLGRGLCGWVCPFGGLSEIMITGRKERWNASALKSWRGSRYLGLKAWVMDVKYGVLLASLLLSIVLAFPVVCVLCPVFWLTSIPVFWGVIALVVIFSIVLPFITKSRWWCQICPMGAVLSLTDKNSLFRIRINKQKCDKC